MNVDLPAGGLSAIEEVMRLFRDLSNGGTP